MRRFCIDSRILGTPRHIVGDAEGYAWSDSVPRDSWHLSGELKTSSTARCLDTLLRLRRVDIPRIPARYTTAMSTLVTGSMPGPVPWVHAVPQGVYREFFKNLVQKTMDEFPRLPFDYYETAWTAGSRVLSSLRPARVDPTALDAIAASEGSAAPALEGFRPKRSGLTHPVVYDRFSTRTGRLTVVEGPNILVLKKGSRGVLRSTFEGGTVCSLDFRALEARIVLAEAGRSSDAEDMYDDIARGLLGGRVARDTVKTAVISELYGISRSSLKARLGVTDAELGTFITAIRSHFGVEELRRRLKEEATATGHIVNRFGRSIPVPSGQDNLLVNTYAQSSGVDVAMLGFDSVLRLLGGDGIRPIFVLHDALLLDVAPHRLEDVRSTTNADVLGYDVAFPLKFDPIAHV